MRNSDLKAMGNLKENTIEELTVVRLSDMGAFLEAGTGNTSDDILLHNNQQTHPVCLCSFDHQIRCICRCWYGTRDIPSVLEHDWTSGKGSVYLG